jgi:hypothetical protein
MQFAHEIRRARPAFTPQLLLIGALTSIPFIVALALFLAARRMSGAMTAPAAPSLLVVTAIAMLGWMLLVHITIRLPTSGRADAANIFRSLPIAASWLSLILVAFACSFPGNRLLDWLVWLPTFAAAWLAPRFLVSRRFELLGRPAQVQHSPTAEIATEDRVLQQVTRYRSADGRETVHAQLRAEFSPGQRVKTLYVAFCPPFEQLPHVEAHLADEQPANATLTQVLHNGAQIDVRLPRPASAQAPVSVELIATEPPIQ